MLLAFFSVQLFIFINDMCVLNNFNNYVVFILGDLLCMESSGSFTDYPHGLPINKLIN